MVVLPMGARVGSADRPVKVLHATEILPAQVVPMVLRMAVTAHVAVAIAARADLAPAALQAASAVVPEDLAVEAAVRLGKSFHPRWPAN
jgi:hypothetical protein